MPAITDDTPPPSRAKQRVLAAAAKLFRQNGYAATTVRALAGEIGILSGSVFHHFKSKDDILFAVMDGVIDAMDDGLTEALSTARTPRDRVRALICNQLQFIHGPMGDAAAVLIYEWNALSPEARAKLLSRRNAYFERWHDVLSEARDAGLITMDPTVLRQLLHGAIVWTTNWYDPGGKVPLSELQDSVLALALRD